jgi:hypothetical protein
MTRSILKSKLALGFALVAGSLAVGRSAQAEMLVPIPISGGQFSVEVKIQDGFLHNYGYQNQQLPTLLTPVGTISLTNATVPRLVPRLSAPNLTPINPNTPTSARLDLTGSTALNDGRRAAFNGAPAILHGITNFSSPFPLNSLEYLKPLTSANAQPMPIENYGPGLPQDYAGVIAFQVHAGHFLVPSSALSSPSNSLTQLGISSGQIQVVGRSRGARALGDYSSVENVHFDSYFDYALETFVKTTLSGGAAADLTIPSKQVTLLSPMGTTALSLTYLARSVDQRQSTVVEKMEGRSYKPNNEISSAVANGTVTLNDGSVVQVTDQLMTFQGRTSRVVPFGPMIDSMFALKYEYTIDVTQGSLYINAPKAVNIPQNLNLLPIAADPLAQLATTTTTSQAFPETVEQIKLNTELNPPSELSTTRAVLESPLSSSRILPEMGSFR